MYSYVKQVGIPTVLAQEAPAFAASFVIAEVFYKYTPIAPGLLFDEAVTYRRAFFKPRLGALTDNPS